MELDKVVAVHNTDESTPTTLSDITSMVICGGNAIGPRHKARNQLLSSYNFKTGIYTQFCIRAVTGQSHSQAISPGDIWTLNQNRPKIELKMDLKWSWSGDPRANQA